MSVELLAFPHLAPLSTPMILHLLDEDAESLRRQMREPSPSFLQKWMRFAHEVQRARSVVFSLVTSALERRELSLAWFRETVTGLLVTRTPERVSQQKSQEERSAISRDTVAEWKKNHVLRPPDRGQMELDCIAAIFIACLVDPQVRLKNFLPGEVDPAEPYWYCYSRAAPTSPIIPCPIPLPRNLPNATLLWTPWSGAAWNDSWLSLGDMGAARWFGASTERGRLRWTLTKDDLRKWDQEISRLDMGLLFDTGLLGREPLHSFANTALVRLAVTELSASAQHYDGSGI